MDTNRKGARKLLDGESMDQFVETMRNAKLTDVQKQVCEYRYVKGYSFTKIACQIGYSLDTVYRIHSKVLEKVANANV